MKKVRWVLLLIALGFALVGLGLSYQGRATGNPELGELGWAMRYPMMAFGGLWLLSGLVGAVVTASIRDATKP